MVDESSKKCSQILENVWIPSFKKKKKKLGSPKVFFTIDENYQAESNHLSHKTKKLNHITLIFFLFSLSLSLSLSLSYCSSLHESNRKSASSIKSRKFFGNKIRFRKKKKKKAILKMSALCRVIGWEGWVPKPNLSCIYIIICTRKHKPLCLSNVWIATVS